MRNAGQPGPPSAGMRDLRLAARPVLEVWAAWIVVSPRRGSVGSIHGAPKPRAPVVIAVSAEIPHMRVGVRRDRKPAKRNCRACEKSKDSVHHWLLRCPQPASGNVSVGSYND